MLIKLLTPPPAHTVIEAQSKVIANRSEPRTLRPTSNLKSTSKWTVERSQRFQNGLYFFNNKFKGKMPPDLVFCSMISSILFPELPQKATTLFIKNKFKPVLENMDKAWIESGAQAMVTIKRDDENKRFIATVPMVAFLKEGLPAGIAKAAFLATGDTGVISDPTANFVRIEERARQIADSGTGQRFTMDNLKAVGNVSELLVNNAKKLGLTLIIRPIGNFVVALMEVPFSQRECESMCNSEWLTIRPLDMYGMINAWVAGYYGRRARSPSSTIPLVDIAKQSEAKTVAPRLSPEGVLVNEDGEIYALPEKLNNIYQYEDATAAALTHADGSFGTFSPEGVAVKLPPAMPVFVDWVNLKFAYTSLDGKLLVMNLDRSQPLNITHARRFIERRLESSVAGNFVSTALQMAAFANLLQGEQRSFFTKLYKEVSDLGMSRESYQSTEEIPLVCIYDYSVPSKDAEGHESAAGPLCQQFVSTMQQLRKFIETNPTNAYARYSVTTVCTLLAQLKVFLDYGGRYSEVIAEDNTKRKAYMNQGEDPDFKLSAVPLVEPGRGLLPHQAKVQNLLKDRPDNAMLPVDAGGGKTSLVVYEILREIMDDDGKQGLCMVLCPSHLVAQYVKEFAYFTGVRVNVIPVTSYTIRRQGFERLKSMIQNAPPNSVVISDYNAILLGASTVAYGTAVVRTFPVIEFLRQFVYKFVACDESHFLKNGSSRNSAVGRLIIDIKKKRLASGTMVADTVTDLVRQTGLMDPTVFGSTAEFIEQYALEVRGSKVIKWKDGAELAIKRHLSQHVVMAEAKRKEWAAILPFPRIFFHPVELSKNQQLAYHEVLNKVVETLLEKAKENKALADLLSGKVDPDELGADLDALMKPYLARLERFITAPGKDPYGSTVLQGEDKVSPKIHEINNIIKEHLNENRPGKILIFTNYELSTDAIWEGLAMAGLQEQAIYYTAANKDECGAEFEKNPNKKIMVGIEQSLNTGLNLQFCSVLIRVESVWTPGVMEQGNSRIGRPNIKVREERKYIYYHTITANRTIDVTKSAYLMAKTVSKAKFDEAGNPRFDDLETPPLLKMTLDTIQSENDWDETMRDYFEKFQSYQQALAAEYAEYREKNKDKLFDSAGNLKIEVMERAANPEGAALMRRIPYVPGTELYKASELGLLRYDDFLSKNHSAHVEDEEDEGVGLGSDEEGDDDDDKEVNEKDMSAEKRAALEAERALCIGLAVHTDHGDGEIVRVNAKALIVRLPGGDVIRVRKLAAFIITRANTSGKDIRNQLLKMTGDVPIDKPIDVLETKIDPRIEEAAKQNLEKQKNRKEDSPIEMELSFTVANDFLGISLENIQDERAVKVAQSLGFKFTPAYFAAQVKLPKQMLAFFRAIKDKGFDVDKEGNQACAEAFLHYRANRTLPNLFFGYASSANVKNFFRKEFKPKADNMFIQPYPLIQDGKMYLCLPKDGHPGSVNAIRKSQSSGLKWMVYDSDSEMINFVSNKAQASTLIKRILSMGITIRNIKKLQKEFSSLRMVNRKSVDED